MDVITGLHVHGFRRTTWKITVGVVGLGRMLIFSGVNFFVVPCVACFFLLT